jgi:hypothetical protein
MLSAPNAFASVIACPNCSYQTMMNRAVGQGVGSYYVWNPVNAEIHQFLVSCGVPPLRPDGEQDSRTVESGIDSRCYATEGNVLAGYRDMAANLSPIYNGTAGTYQAKADVRADNWTYTGYPLNPPTANDYVTDVNLRGQLNDHLDEAGMSHAISPIAAFLEYVMAHGDAAVQFTDNLSITVTVLFVNDSKVKVELRLNHPARYVAGTARDDTGQVIPDANSSNNAGRWTYGGDQQGSGDSMLSTMRNLGFLIVGSVPHPFRTINCTWQGPPQNKLSCIVAN